MSSQEDDHQLLLGMFQDSGQGHRELVPLLCYQHHETRKGVLIGPLILDAETGSKKSPPEANPGLRGVLERLPRHFFKI